MKTISKSGVAFMMITVIFFFFSSCTSSKEMAQGSVSASVSYQMFYDDLSPYGTWIEYPPYGHVWHPAVEGEFRPYLTNGYWDYSDEGWMWISDYNWGWAPFHYGRWTYDDAYGWLWIPGYEWSPAWVTWGSVDDYYAWAPLMPEVNVGVQYSSWRPPSYYWNICRKTQINDRNIFNVVEKREDIANYASRINVINNFNATHLHNQYYAKGPELNEVEKFTNRKIEPVTIRNINVNNRTAIKQEGNQLHVYRPVIATPQPRQFRRMESNNTHPLLNDNEYKINMGLTRQRENIERLPVLKAPESMIKQGAIRRRE